MGMAQQSSAFAPPHGKKGFERELVTVGRDARVDRNVTWRAPVGTTLGSLVGWTVMWDRDTGVPLRMWGAGVTATNAVADAGVAEAIARQFLADHLDVLAPGAMLGDFTLVANQLGISGDVRSVAFEQRQNGLRVLGGTVGFAFKGDHLTMVSSTALPNVHSSIPASHLTQVGMAANAITWLAGSGHTVRVRTPSAHPSLLGNAGERVILPIVHARASGRVDVEYHLTETVLVESTKPAGRWQVYLDAATGAPVARRNALETLTGTITFDTPDQAPALNQRSAKPAPFLTTVINGTSVTADINGVATFTGADPGTVNTSLAGTYIAVSDVSQALSADTLSLPSGGSVVWSQAATPFSDAELDAYVAANHAKSFVRAQLNPELAWLNQQLSVTVNEGSSGDPSASCNAYSTGDDIHFYVPGPITRPDGTAGNCENTGRMADVVMHESGHSVHNNSVIPGMGAFPPTDGQSEGLADTLAVSITGDPGLGRGFFLDSTPLRDLAPAVPKTWPVASGEVHDEGEILDESLWDLRQALQTKLGTDAGFAQLLKIYYGIMQRSPDIPSAYSEALLADDDDGDLTNGTPNKCEIDASFARHGLADAADILGIKSPVRDGFQITIPTPAPSGTCPVTTSVTSATLTWHVRGGTDATLPLATATAGYTAAIPTQPDGTTVEYQVAIALDDGTTMQFPDNPADPYYEFYVGTVTNIYCTGFEPGFDSWTHSGTRDEWQAGAPHGVGGDPNVAHTGSNVAGIDLGDGSSQTSDGDYEAQANEALISPMIDLMGHTSVHLQYYRWLGVEDAEFDHATISANGVQVWTNKATGTDPQGTDEVNHVDKEWVFEDVDLTAAIGSGAKVQVTFGLTSDQGENLGGWNIDDVCVVAVAPAPPGPGTCGNGVVDTGETCDDGNTTAGDGCSATCQTETPVDMGKDGGCCSVGGNPATSGVLGLLTLGLVLRRRKKQS